MRTLAGTLRALARLPRRAGKLVALAAFFLADLLRANLRVATDVVTRAHRSSPGVVAVPLRAETDLEITLLANLISLTPGTLALEVSPDRSVLYVHAMFAADADAVRRGIRDGFERRLLEVLR